MELDVLVVFLAVLSGVWGALRGCVREGLAASALLLAYGLSIPLGAALGPQVLKQYSMRVYLGQILASAGVLLMVYLVFRVALGAEALVRLLLGKPFFKRLHPTNRAFGFLIGFTRTTVLAFLLVSCLAPAEFELFALGRDRGVRTDSSALVQLGARYPAYVRAPEAIAALLAPTVSETANEPVAAAADTLTQKTRNPNQKIDKARLAESLGEANPVGIALRNVDAYERASQNMVNAAQTAASER